MFLENPSDCAYCVYVSGNNYYCLKSIEINHTLSIEPFCKCPFYKKDSKTKKVIRCGEALVSNTIPCASCKSREVCKFKDIFDELNKKTEEIDLSDTPLTLIPFCKYYLGE